MKCKECGYPKMTKKKLNEVRMRSIARYSRDIRGVINVLISNGYDDNKTEDIIRFFNSKIESLSKGCEDDRILDWKIERGKYGTY